MSTSDPNTDPSTSSTARAPGSKLAGCYALTRRLEVGIATEVWLANDEVLGKDVSLHFAPEAVRKDNRALQELRLDIKKNRQLIHPNILRVYDLVEEPDWVAVSMDVFEGEALAAQIERQAGQPGEASAIQSWAEQVFRTLEEAHKINALHRDLSPSNIFLTPAGKALVANFGISRSIRDAQTRAGEATISPFTSPQLTEGKAPARTDDVFSLGAILYNAVVGKAPAAGDGLSDESRAGLESANAPASWKATIAACLDKNPEARPQSAAEVGRRWAAPAGEAAPAAAPAVVPAPATPATPAAAEAPVVAAAVAAAAAATPEVAVAKPVAEPIERVEEPAKPVEEPARRVEEPVAPAEEPAKRVEEPAKRVEEPAKRVEEPATPVEAVATPVAESPKRVEEPIQRVEEPVKRVDEHVKRTEEPVKAAAEPIKRVEDPDKAVTETNRIEEWSKTGRESTSKSPVPEKETRKEVSRTTSSPSSQKGPERPEPKDFKSRMYPEESRFPVTGLAAAAVVLALIAIIYYFSTSKKSSTAGPDSGPAPSATPVNVPATPAVTPTIATSTPTPGPSTPAPVTPNPAAMALAEKTAAVEKAKQEAAAAEKAIEDLRKEQKAAEETLASTKKMFTEKTESAKSMTKVVEELTRKRKELEDDKKATESSSVEAQKFAEAKARRAADAAKTLEEFDKASAEKLAAPQQVESEIASLQKQIDEVQRTMGDAAKAVAAAEAAKNQQLAAVAAQEREIEQMKLSAAEPPKVKPPVDPLPLPTATPPLPTATPPTPPRSKIDDEIAEMERIFNEKKKELERKRLEMENAGKQTPAPLTPDGAASKTTPPGDTPTISLTTPAPSATPFRARDVAMLSSTPPPSLATPAPTVEPGPTVMTTGGNSLGMRFVPVGDVDFCVWQTRVKDFEVFAKAVNLRSMAWKGPGFKQGPDHPVVNVSWNEAVAFCKWLTDKEHKDNTLPASQFYRLPTDLEWSKAVGLPDETGKTPEMRDMGIPDVYPWGNVWPPPAGAGNYTGEETGSDVAIKGYDDGFPWTSPVGSFPPNKFGLYDMGGNVWQWCMDTWNADSKAKVLRGASWYNGALKLSLLSSCRVHAVPDSSTDNYGFRIVRAKEEKAARK